MIGYSQHGYFKDIQIVPGPVPASITSRLYSVTTHLYWNGVRLDTIGGGGGGSMTWPPNGGIPIYSGASTWSASIVNNSANWNTAFSWGNHAGLYWLKADTGAINKLAGWNWAVSMFATKESKITAASPSPTLYYWRGDKTWQLFPPPLKDSTYIRQANGILIDSLGNTYYVKLDTSIAETKILAISQLATKEPKIVGGTALQYFWNSLKQWVRVDYDSLINKPTIPAAQIQSDWNQANNALLDYIKNKPALPRDSTYIRAGTGISIDSTENTYTINATGVGGSSKWDSANHVYTPKALTDTIYGKTFQVGERIKFKNYPNWYIGDRYGRFIATTDKDDGYLPKMNYFTIGTQTLPYASWSAGYWSNYPMGLTASSITLNATHNDRYIDFVLMKGNSDIDKRVRLDSLGFHPIIGGISANEVNLGTDINPFDTIKSKHAKFINLSGSGSTLGIDANGNVIKTTVGGGSNDSTYIKQRNGILVDSTVNTYGIKLDTAIAETKVLATSQLLTKEPVIVAATPDPTLKYWRGDKSWQTLPTYTSYSAGYRMGLSSNTFNNLSYWKDQDTVKTTLSGVLKATAGKLSIAIKGTDYDSSLWKLDGINGIINKNTAYVRADHNLIVDDSIRLSDQNTSRIYAQGKDDIGMNRNVYITGFGSLWKGLYLYSCGNNAHPRDSVLTIYNGQVTPTLTKSTIDTTYSMLFNDTLANGKITTKKALSDGLATKANTSHSQAISTITNLQAALDSTLHKKDTNTNKNPYAKYSMDQLLVGKSNITDVKIWYPITCTYASTITCTMTGTQVLADQLWESLIQWQSTAGVIRVGRIASAVYGAGTITLTVYGTANMASGDKLYYFAPNMKLRPWERRITIPGEQITDATNPQGMWFQGNDSDSLYIFDVSAWVLTAAAGAGAACAYNIYAGASNLFLSAVDLTTNTSVLHSQPNTVLIAPSLNLTLRLTSSAGATNKASNFQVRFFAVPLRVIYGR